MKNNYMESLFTKQRLYASVMIIGIGFLLFRTIRMMLVEEAFQVLKFWVVILMLAECLLDFGTVVGSIRWFILNNNAYAGFSLRMGAAAIILHAIRVMVYVLGRTGPWINFDVKPEYHDAYTFEWHWVYLAGILSVLGVVGVLVIWKKIHNGRIESDV